MRIVTNFARFPKQWSTRQGLAGSAVEALNLEQFVQYSQQADLLLINGDLSLTQSLALRSLNPFHRQPPLVIADLVLRQPKSAPAHAMAAVRRLLFARVDLFINYFRHSPGYAQYFGITPERCRFVEFKPNLDPSQLPPLEEGEYVLCFGRSLRDYDTFFSAMSTLPALPAAIPHPDFNQLRHHRSRFTWPLDQLPGNVTLLREDGSVTSMIEILSHARLVVLPIVPGSLAPSGLSVYLNAMLLGKCVIISEGPGVTDVLPPGVALTVPPGDPRQLADAIALAWQNESQRRALASAGRSYALSLGGEPELYQRILEQIAHHFPGSPTGSRSKDSAAKH